MEFNQLKRIAGAGRATVRKRVTPAFVELIAPQTAVAPTCIIELDGQRGTLRIEWKVSVAAKKGTSLAVEREPGVGLRFGLRWAQK